MYKVTGHPIVFWKSGEKLRFLKANGLTTQLKVALLCAL